ncbi:hypothetical protein DFH07DRAFT_800462 [Mycena maculata]|uniref:Uncharacterized protein n=1 Tax=Mycena maculata TaxID=230809 RepID=A0AAD7NTP1_9AGAR|nr:hypothetical protein DFH07DRAFT_800462 [Mycena maculata]
MSSRSRAGLPSGPGPRSRSVTRPRDVERSDRYDGDGDTPSRSSARQVRPQKSMTSMNQGRPGPRQPPPMPSSRSRRDPEPSYDTRSDSRSGTNRSSDSTTSSGSSFLDRMKQSAGYASSRTSLEDDEYDKASVRSARNRPARRAVSPPPETDTPGDGYTLWSKVSSVASSLTVNVGKAWATNITTFAGEETPVGQESRLTRAMKAYHLEKARDPSDLPPWLFDANERRRLEPEPSRSNRSRRNRDDDDDYEVVEKTRGEPPPSRGLRDIYEAAASTSSNPSARSTRGARSYADDVPQPSKATDRLKALRDAKRTAVNPSALSREEERAPPRAEREAETPQPRRRVGLPSGPVSRRF